VPDGLLQAPTHSDLRAPYDNISGIKILEVASSCRVATSGGDNDFGTTADKVLKLDNLSTD